MFGRKLQPYIEKERTRATASKSIRLRCMCANVFSGRIEWCSLDYSLPMALLLTKRHWPSTHKNRPANDRILVVGHPVPNGLKKKRATVSAWGEGGGGESVFCRQLDRKHLLGQMLRLGLIWSFLCVPADAGQNFARLVVLEPICILPNAGWTKLSQWLGLYGPCYTLAVRWFSNRPDHCVNDRQLRIFSCKLYIWYYLS